MTYPKNNYSHRWVAVGIAARLPGSTISYCYGHYVPSASANVNPHLKRGEVVFVP